MGKGSFHNPFKKLRGLGEVREPAQPSAARPTPRAEKAAAPRAPVEDPPPSSDEATFLAAMHGVSTLENRERVEPPKQEGMRPDDEEAIALEEFRSFASGEGAFDIEDSGERVVGRAPGVSDLLLKDLAAGRYAYQRHLDLHGFRREAAREALTRFVSKARKDGLRCILVITGVGKGSPQGQGVLRETVPRWLSRLPSRANVLAFSTAQQVDGGRGALYILLRKSGR